MCYYLDLTWYIKFMIRAHVLNHSSNWFEFSLPQCVMPLSGPWYLWIGMEYPVDFMWLFLFFFFFFFLYIFFHKCGDLIRSLSPCSSVSIFLHWKVSPWAHPGLGMGNVRWQVDEVSCPSWLCAQGPHFFNCISYNLHPTMHLWWDVRVASASHCKQQHCGRWTIFKGYYRVCRKVKSCNLSFVNNELV